MNNFIEKIKFLEKSLADKHGAFYLFCIVEIEDNQGQWDIVVSADWLPASESKAAEIVIDHVYDFFDKNDLEQLGRVIVLRSDESFISRVSEIGDSQLFDIEINGLSIKRLYVISSQLQTCKNKNGQNVLNLIKKLSFEDLYCPPA